MPAHPSTSPSQWMYFLTYTPRADSAARGYDEWLREVDNPFFNSVPEIVRYENWKVAERLVGSIPWDYFDLMYVESPESAQRIWTNPDVQRFADGWFELWGVDPKSEDWSVNVHIFLCEEVAGPIVPERSEHCLFIQYARRADAESRDYDTYLREEDNPFFNSAQVPELISDANWHVVEDVVGHEEWTDFDLMFVPGPDGWERFTANPIAADFAGKWIKSWGQNPDGGPEENLLAALGELVASPEKSSPRPGAAAATA
jgi:hypothetical protein